MYTQTDTHTMYTQANRFKDTYPCIHRLTHIPCKHTLTDTFKHTHVYTDRHIYPCIHTDKHIYTHLHTDIQIHANTHTQTNILMIVLNV